MSDLSFLLPQKKFEKDEVRDIVKASIKNVIGNAKYTDSLITTWTNELMEAVIIALTKLQRPFKYIGKLKLKSKLIDTYISPSA